MTDKFWTSRIEWLSHASCGGDIRFIMSPDQLSANDVEDIEDTCAGCPVRPECIRDVLPRKEWATEPNGKRVEVTLVGNSVWCVGEFIPDHETPANRRRADEVRWGMFRDLPKELAWRPEEIL